MKIPENVQVAIMFIFIGTACFFWGLWSATHDSYFANNDIIAGLMMWVIGWVFGIIAYNFDRLSPAAKDI